MASEEMNNQKKNQLDGQKNDKNKTKVIVAISLAFLLILVGIYLKLGIIDFSSNTKKADPTSASPAKIPTSTTLKATANQPASSPSPTDKKLPSGSIFEDSPMDPFTGPYTLAGVVLNHNGRNVAILESNGKSYVVAEKEYLDNTWQVVHIALNQVQLSYKGKTQTLALP